MRGWGPSWSLALAVVCLGGWSPAFADPLAVHTTNPRYFDDGSGRAVYLVGSHTWDNFQDWGSPTPDFHYNQFLDLLEANDHNFFRLWSWESTGVDTGAAAEHDPMPWKRTGPGTAADGGLKFDLTQFDNAYFNRMRSRIIDARNRGMYVAIMLFQQYVDWPTHPFHSDNNINGVGGNANNLHTLHDDEFVEFQEAYVQKVIDTVNDLDNVLYEIGNELVDNTINWQHHMIDFIHDYEASKPKQHPVGMTSTGSSGTGSPLITNAELLASPADWIAPHVESGQDYAQNPPAATGAKVIVSDTDHLVGVICTPNADLARAWAWRSFTRGLHLLWMEATQNVIPGVSDSCQNTNNPAYGPVRRAMGDTRLYAERMDLAAMTPRSDLTSTSYALANPGIEYLVFQPGSGLLTVNLVQGSYDYEWFNPATSLVVETGTFSAGDGTRQFTPPFNGAAVLYLVRNGSTSPPVANFSGSPRTGLAPLNVTFTDTSTGDITNRHWTFGDGATTTTTATNLAHSYSTAGVYTVRLIVSGIFGVSTNSKVNYITATNPPAPAMIEIDPPAAGFPITATGTTTFANFIVINNGGSPLTGTASALGGPFSVVSGSPFNVPAGNLSIVSVGFAPTAAGTFSNQIVFASNAGNSTNAVVGTAAVPPTANFSAIVRTGMPPLNVTFTDASTGSVTNRFFHFGDGATTNITGTSVAHQYNSAGSFTVTEIVQGLVGASTNVKAGYIVVTNPPAPAPVLGVSPSGLNFSLLATGATATANFVVTNTGGSTLSGTATALGGPFSVLSGSPFNISPAGSATVSVRFGPTSAGSFTNAVAFNSNGGSSTNTVTGSAAIPPSANFSANVRTGMPPLNVTFTDASTGTITNRFFQFGDGATTNLTGSSVAHAYNSTGSFTVVAIASGPLGASTNTKFNHIVVTNSLDPAVLGVSPGSRNFPLLSTGAVALADFVVTNRGESALVGSASALGGPFSVVSGSPFNVPGFGSASVTVRFAPVTAGTFTNQVVVTSNGGASTNVVTGSAAVTPIANFSGAPTTGQKPLVVGFTDSSTGTITNRHWDFGDGFATNTVLANVSHSYANAGTFHVTLTVEGPLGANAKTRTNYIVVAQSSGPTPNFIATPTAGKAALMVTFVNQTVGSGLSYLWDFGDGETSTLANPLHTYSNAGTYSVSLTAMNSSGTNTFPRDNYIHVTNSIPSDASPPVLNVQTPDELQVFTSADILVAGTASDASGLQSVTINGAAAALAGEDWSAPYALAPGTNTLTVIATDNSVSANSVTQTVRAILGPQPGAADTNAPLVTILSPADGSIVTGRFVQVTGTAQDDGFVASVVITNSRGGSTGATLIGEDWTAGGVMLKVGTNQLFALATDGALNKSGDSITIIRVHTNLVNTTLRVTGARLTRDGGENGDSVSVQGLFNDAGPAFDPATETSEFLFGDYEAMLPANSLLKLKYKAKASPTNTLTSVKLSTKKRSFAFDATGFTLTTLDPFLVAMALGTNDLGPDAITFPVPPGGTGRFDWAFGSQANALDQFFLGKSKLTTTSFNLSGWIVALVPPNPTIEGVCFGIGNYDDVLPAGGWTQGKGNVFTFTPPIGYTGPVRTMTIDLDRGEWSIKGEGSDLGFLANDPITSIQIEIGDFAATYRAKLIRKGEKFSY